MDAEVGVVGIGTIGSMAMWQLARRGVSVIGFEQFGIGHDRSAAGGETRIFRTVYKEGPQFVPLLEESYQLWLELERETHRNLLTLTNGLTIGASDQEFMKTALKSIEAYNLDHEILNYKEAKKRYPQHRLLPDEMIILDKRAGFLRPEYAVVSATQRAQELGATIHSHTYVENIEPNNNGVTVRANGVDYKVNKLLITTGPWASELIPEFRKDITVRRLISTWFPAKNIEKFTVDQFPVFTRTSIDDGFYGFPSLDGSMVKIVYRSTKADEIENAHNLDRNVKVDELVNIRRVIEQYLPDLLPDPVRINVYMEGYTQDRQFKIGKIPGYENIVTFCGFSGNGFKMAPVMGEIASELLVNGNTNYPVSSISSL